MFERIKNWWKSKGVGKKATNSEIDEMKTDFINPVFSNKQIKTANGEKVDVKKVLDKRKAFESEFFLSRELNKKPF